MGWRSTKKKIGLTNYDIVAYFENSIPLGLAQMVMWKLSVWSYCSSTSAWVTAWNSKQPSKEPDDFVNGNGRVENDNEQLIDDLKEANNTQDFEKQLDLYANDEEKVLDAIVNIERKTNWKGTNQRWKTRKGGLSSIFGEGQRKEI